MYASSLASVEIEEPGLADPLNQPGQPIAALDQFQPRQTLQHRITVAGTATLVDTNLNFFFIQDADSGVRVETRGNRQVRPGDYVIASGYPDMGSFGSLLRDAVFKVIKSQGQMPAPHQIPTVNPLDPQLHDLWVQIEARFMHYSKIGDVDVLTLQVGNRIFDARFISPVSDRIKNLQSGSLLRVSGIYRLLSDEARKPVSLQLAVPSEQDIQILEEPSWWTIKHTISVIGVMAFVIGATALWVLQLRRKVRQQTASLRQSESKFRSLVEQSLVGVYIIQNDRFIYANPQLAEIFGHPPGEAASPIKLDDVIVSEDLASMREQIRRQIASENDYAHYSIRGRRKDGSIIHLEVLGSRTESGGKPAVLGMVMDVTERKLSQDKIAEQARMLDLASDGIVVCSLDDRILYWNQSAGRIYGWTVQEAIGAIACEKLDADSAEFQKAKETLLRDNQWQGEFNHHNRQGEKITVAARWTLIQNSQGKAGSILAIYTDITRQKQLEAQFLRTQRLDSIGVLAGGIAHDLNNVLAPILMSGRLLEMDPDSSDRGEMISNILNSTRRAADLVKQILTFARGTDGRRAATQPRQLLEDLQKLLNESLPKSISLHFNCDPDTRLVDVNATHLHQVLMNLCINSRDAMPNGGELSITAANVELDEQEAATNGKVKPGAYVVFSVTDNGSGIPPEIRDRIFDPFFTTKEVGKGTGLGLSIALGLIKSHGGFINVQSTPNHGTCFKVYLPAHLATRPADETPAYDNGAVRGENELILVVDDEAPVRNIAKQTLKMFGYRVVTANNGEEAVSCYSEQKDEIALVLLDMMMPVMDGPATIAALAKINPDIKIIAASGLTGEGQLTSPTVRAFLPKPYTAEKMLNAVYLALHSKVADQKPAG